MLHASPEGDLASPFQEKRDEAAKILRATYVPAPRSKWDSLMSNLKLGSAKTNVLQVLGTYTNNIAGGGGSGATEMERYGLDDLWLLECSFTGDDSHRVLTNVRLVQGLRAVSVEPPRGFTGTWITYYVNGQKSGEGHFKNGLPDGECIGFHPDGSRMLVNHSRGGALDGEEVGFYESGAIEHKGLYQTNSQIGTWIWYNKDGSIQTQRDFSKP